MFDDSKLRDLMIAFMEKENKVPWESGVISHALAFGGIRANGEAYKGVNALTTFMEIEMRDLRNRTMLTFNEIKTRGGTLKKGSRSAMIMYPLWLCFDETGRKLSTSEAAERKALGMKVYEKFRGYRYYNVFSICDTDLPWQEDESVVDRIALHDMKCDAIVDGWRDKPAISHCLTGSADGSYCPATDTVRIPTIGLFRSPAYYYGTLFHELVHSTGHQMRLGRKMAGSFGSSGYAKEELIAEIGAAMLLSRTDLAEEECMENHAAYVASWQKHIKGSNGFMEDLMKAWTAAQRASDWILNDTPNKEVAIAV